MKNNRASSVGRHNLPDAVALPPPPPPRRELTPIQHPVPTDQTVFTTEPSEQELITYLRQEKIKASDALTIIVTNQAKPKHKETAEMKLEAQSDINKKELNKYFTSGVRVGMAMCAGNHGPNDTQTRFAAFMNQSVPIPSKTTNNGTRKMEEDKITNQVRREVISSLRELFNEGTIHIDCSKLQKQTPTPAVSIVEPAGKKGPVPPLKKIRVDHHSHPPAMPAYIEAPTQSGCLAAAAIATPFVFYPYATNSIPHALPPKVMTYENPVAGTSKASLNKNNVSIFL